MKELDGNIAEWYEKKGDELTFSYRGGIYYMTHGKEIERQEVENDGKKSESIV